MFIFNPTSSIYFSLEGMKCNFYFLKEAGSFIYKKLFDCRGLNYLSIREAKCDFYDLFLYPL